MYECYVKQKPFVDNEGIYVPINEYVHEGSVSNYRCLITKEMFVEAYNKWIKEQITYPTYSDDADDWSED